MLQFNQLRLHDKFSHQLFIFTIDKIGPRKRRIKIPVVHPLTPRQQKPLSPAELEKKAEFLEPAPQSISGKRPKRIASFEVPSEEGPKTP